MLDVTLGLKWKFGLKKLIQSLCEKLDYVKVFVNVTEVLPHKLMIHIPPQPSCKPTEQYHSRKKNIMITICDAFVTIQSISYSRYDFRTFGNGSWFME